MKQPTFLEGVVVALAASCVGAVVYAALTLVFPGAWVLRLLIAGIGLGYVLYLLSRSRERVGRVSVIALWSLVAAATWLLQPGLLVYVLVHLGLIGLIRSLYFYAGLLSALADLGLNGLSLAAAIWATLQSGSIFLSIWCFFLVQALFVAIPTSLDRTPQYGRSQSEDRFERAYRAATAAVRKLSAVD